MYYKQQVKTKSTTKQKLTTKRAKNNTSNKYIYIDVAKQRSRHGHGISMVFYKAANLNSFRNNNKYMVTREAST